METLLPSKYVHSFNLNSFQEKGRTKRQRRGYVRSYVVEELDGWLDGWTVGCNCDITFLSVFQTYQDDGRMIMKVYVQWSSVYNYDKIRDLGLSTTMYMQCVMLLLFQSLKVYFIQK